MKRSAAKNSFVLLCDSIVMGFALFAMFFGAGNLIFPPLLGQESGQLWPVAFVGFILMDAVLACLGVYAVNASGGPRRALEQALGQKGGDILNAMAILCLCVLFAMPRTAATSYEIALAPYIGSHRPWALLIFSIMFFVVVYMLAHRESRIVDIIGRFFTPLLVIGVLIVVIAGIAFPLGGIQAPRIDNVVERGFRSGYQTMDVLGVVAFSIMLNTSHIARKYQDSHLKLMLITRASVIATVMLAVIYGGLTYLGATSVALGTDLSQVQLLVAIVKSLLGDFGVALLGIIVLLACITTAVALVGSAAAFFNRILKNKISYHALLVMDCLIGILICNVGLDRIIEISHYVLGVVYPPFMTVIIMLLFRSYIPVRGVYWGAAIGAFFMGGWLELYQAGVVSQLPLDVMPLYSVGLAWPPFAALGGLIGYIVARLRGRSSDSLGVFAIEEGVQHVEDDKIEGERAPEYDPHCEGKICQIEEPVKQSCAQNRTSDNHHEQCPADGCERD